MQLDLRDVIKMIEEAKPDLKLGLSLEFDCFVEAEDPKPLIKVLNYLLNFIKQSSDETIQISLNAGMDGIILNLIASTTISEKPEMNAQIPDVLNDYAATIQYDFKAGEFMMFLITFAKDDIVIR